MIKIDVVSFKRPQSVCGINGSVYKADDFDEMHILESGLMIFRKGNIQDFRHVSECKYVHRKIDSVFVSGIVKGQMIEVKPAIELEEKPDEYQPVEELPEQQPEEKPERKRFECICHKCGAQFSGGSHNAKYCESCK